MSSDDKNKKIDDTETEEDKSSQDEAEPEKGSNDRVKAGGDKEDSKPAVNDVKGTATTNDEATDGEGDTEEEEKEEVKKPAKKRPVKAEEEVKEEKGETEEEEEDDDEDQEEEEKSEKKNGVEGKEQRERKKVDRFQEEREPKKEVSGEIEIPNGKGTPLGECPRIEFFIKQKETDQLKKLHQVLFGRVGKPEKLKSNLQLFKGFDYEPESDAYTKKKQSIAKLDMKHLKEICEILDIEKKGKKDEIVTRVMDFLCDPKDSGKPVPSLPTPRPKRTSAVKANNRGYAGLDADDSEEEGRRGRSTGRRNKSKRPSYKDESSSEEDTTGGRRGGTRKFTDSEVESEPELTPSGSESDAPKKKKAAPAKSKKKAAPKKKAGAGSGAAKSAKKTPAKRGRKKGESESDEQSESEDEPLQKKSKKPPSDDEIKKYVKQILEGANLEEITMKTVCKQVYGRYPDHDLTHKKDLIKTTVKSLIAS